MDNSNPKINKEQIGKLLSWINLLEVAYQNCIAAIDDHFSSPTDAGPTRRLLNSTKAAGTKWSERPWELIRDLYNALGD